MHTSSALSKRIEVFAPAKINLFLHVTGKRTDGYHILDSLVCFADIGDTIIIERSAAFQFNVTGTFAEQLSPPQSQHKYSDSDNLVIRAAKALSEISNNPLDLNITLEKNLPVAAGLGGGSSDAAAVIWGLQSLWGLDRRADYLPHFLISLGADVPVCYHAQASYMRGIGDVLHPAGVLPPCPVLLVNPMMTCATRDVFLRHNGQFQKDIMLREDFDDVFDLVAFLGRCGNDLYEPARHIIPDIDNVLNALKAQKGAMITRMSGSGATCFALFDTAEHASAAKLNISDENPDWFVADGEINTIERY